MAFPTEMFGLPAPRTFVFVILTWCLLTIIFVGHDEKKIGMSLVGLTITLFLCDTFGPLVFAIPVVVFFVWQIRSR